MKHFLWGVLAALVVAIIATLPLPVLDEESYLAIAAQLDPARPYDWWRPWPPWGGDWEADAFVYAHPPLFLWWVWFCSCLGLPFLGLKLLAGLPWVVVFSVSAWVLGREACKRPLLVMLCWLSMPITVFGLQRGLMPDLSMAAMGAASMAAWRARRYFLSGAALFVAAWIKYPALLLLIVVLVDAVHRKKLRESVPLWLTFMGCFLVGEGWLWWEYGRPHLWEVVVRASEIPRGDVGGRFLGVLVRLSLTVPALAFLLPPGRRWIGLPAVALAVLTVLWAGGAARPEQLGVLWAMSTLGAISCVWCVGAIRRGVLTGGDDLFFGTWALVVVLGVIAGHNFAAGRYLLPATIPLAVLVVRALEHRRGSRNVLVALALVHGVVSAAVTLAEHRFARAVDDLALATSAQWPEGGFFTGEWTFRWRMEQQGWVFYTGSAPPDTVILVPTHSSPGPISAEWTPLKQWHSDDRFPFRVVCSDCRIGFYGETLGILPFGFSDSPLESVMAWQTQ